MRIRTTVGNKQYYGNRVSTAQRVAHIRNHQTLHRGKNIPWYLHKAVRVYYATYTRPIMTVHWHF